MAGQSPAAVTCKCQLLLLIPLLLLSVFVFLPFIECRHVTNTNSVQPLKGLRVDLVHVDSVLSPNITSTERVKRAVQRSQERFEKLQRIFAVNTESQLQGDDQRKKFEAPVSAGSAEFLMKIAIGTPAVSFLAVLDTGSDLLWTKCKPCTDCPNSVYNPSSSSTYSKIRCSNSLCQPSPNFSCKNNGDCGYMYDYADKSKTLGILSHESFALSSQSLPNSIAFGCGHDIEGQGLQEIGGLVGFARGPLSLISQLGPSVGNKFSYCLVSITNSDPSRTSPLFIGENAASNLNALSSTPILRVGGNPFYYLSLKDISVAGKALNIPAATFDVHSDNTGGLIIDSGTTLTFLPKKAYDLVKKALTSLINLPQGDGSSMGLDLCFKKQGSSNPSFPAVIFHFQGADYHVPKDNYIVPVSDDLICVMMVPNSNQADPAIFGNVMQQNYQILYDNDKNSLSFAPTVCDTL